MPSIGVGLVTIFSTPVVSGVENMEFPKTFFCRFEGQIVRNTGTEVIKGQLAISNGKFFGTTQSDQSSHSCLLDGKRSFASVGSAYRNPTVVVEKGNRTGLLPDLPVINGNFLGYDDFSNIKPRLNGEWTHVADFTEKKSIPHSDGSPYQLRARLQIEAVQSHPRIVKAELYAGALNLERWDFSNFTLLHHTWIAKHSERRMINGGKLSDICAQYELRDLSSSVPSDIPFQVDKFLKPGARVQDMQDQENQAQFIYDPKDGTFDQQRARIMAANDKANHAPAAPAILPLPLLISIVIACTGLAFIAVRRYARYA